MFFSYVLSLTFPQICSILVFFLNVFFRTTSFYFGFIFYHLLFIVYILSNIALWPKALFARWNHLVALKFISTSQLNNAHTM